MNKLSPKPPIHRANVFGNDDPGHQSPRKLDAGGNGKASSSGPSLRAAVKAIPKT